MTKISIDRLELASFIDWAKANGWKILENDTNKVPRDITIITPFGILVVIHVK